MKTWTDLSWQVEKKYCKCPHVFYLLVFQKPHIFLLRTLYISLKGQPQQIWYYILDSGKLDQYFLQDRLWFLLFLLRSSWDIKKLIFKLLLRKHLLIIQILPEAVPESMLRLPVGFRKPLMYCELRFRKPFRKSFITGLLKPGKKSPLHRVSVRICTISKCFHRSRFTMYV